MVEFKNRHGVPRTKKVGAGNAPDPNVAGVRPELP